MNREQPRILIIEDDATILLSATMYLEDQGYSVLGATDGQNGLSLLDDRLQVVITDIRMPVVDGFAILREINSRFPELPTIVISGTDNLQDVVKALRLGAWDFFPKPIADLDILHYSIRKCIEKATLIRENRIHRRRLEAANEELEAFNRSISHDLRGPLHAMDIFSSILEDDYGPVLDGNGLENLRQIRAAIRRMNTMIEDMLSLSRLSGRTPDKQSVDITAIANDIVHTLTAGQSDSGTAFEIEPDIRVTGDPGLLRNVMENLLGNAWKYTRKADHPRIEVGTCDTDRGITVFVRDNGAGFDMKSAPRLFRLFSRLHSDADFTGNGIGLATVQRIIRCHDGDIRAEARPGQGATFYFTLPV